MYLSHYGLDKKPFDISPDPSFIWLGEKHREALSYLKYGMMENKGFLMITGDVGTGKTALLRCLIQQIDASTFVVAVSDPDMSRLDFFNFLADSLNMGRTFKSKGEFLIHFKRFLKEAYAEQRKVLLIIDESQRLNHELLQEIRLLSNIDLGDRVMLNIFFVGQTEFIQLLREEPNRTVRQRITASFHLDPLGADEVKKYIIHRLKCAGAANQIFTDEAIQRIYEYTTGYPRLINILCDHALMTGYASGATAIVPGMVDECADELKVTFGNRLSAILPKAQSAPDSPPQAGVVTASPGAPPKKSKSALETMRAATAKQVAMFAAKKNRLFLRPLALAFAVFFLLIGAISLAYGPLSGLFTTRNQTKKDFSQNSRSTEAQESQDDARVYKPATTEVPANYSSSDIKTAAWGHSAGGSFMPSDQSPARGSQAMAPSEVGPGDLQARGNHRSTAAGLSDDAGKSPSPQNDSDGGERIPVDAVKRATIYFHYNSYDLPREALAELDRLTAAASQNPHTKISIAGYSDSLGNYRSNRKLSRIRAEIVRDSLIERGIPPENITAVGRGDRDPVGSNQTSLGRQKNRRVEVELKISAAGG